MWFPTANFGWTRQIPVDLACSSARRLRASASIMRLAGASTSPLLANSSPAVRGDLLDEAKPVCFSHTARIRRVPICLCAFWGLVVLIAFPVQVRSQAPAPDATNITWQGNYVADSWQMRDGLPGQTVRAFSETPDGYLWIGTSGGLARFDGSHVQTYTHQNVPALRDDVITRLLTSRGGNLWIATEGGGLIQYSAGMFTSYVTNGIPGGNFIRGLCESSNQVIWVASDVGLFRVKADRLERADTELGIPSFNVGDVLEDHLGRMWVGGGQLFVSDRGKAREYVLQRGDSRSQVKSLLETRDGSIWTGTVEGLYRLSPGMTKFKRVPGVAGTVRSMREDANGDLWIGSIAEGIYLIRNGKVTRFSAPRTSIDSAIFSIFGDSEQDIWIGTRNGMTRLSRSSVQVVSFPDNEDSDFGTISPDENGGLWAASSQLVHVQGRKSTPWHFRGLDGIRIRNVLRAHDRSLWIGTNGYGLYHFRSSAVDHFGVDRGLVDNYVRSLTEARDGSLWIGTDNGVSHLDAHGFHNFVDKEGLAYNSIRSIIEDKAGDIWIGTDHGLSHLRSGLFVDDTATRALSNEKVWSVFQDSDGGMWFGTRGAGLFSYLQGRITQYGTSRGLVSDSIYCILEDARKRLWLSVPNAVMSVDRDELARQPNIPVRTISMHIYSANRGTDTTQLYGGTQPSGLITQAGDFYFPASHGFWIIHPVQEIESHLAHVNVESITIDGRTVPPARSVNLAAASNRIEIAYALVVLNLQDKWRSRYKLDGFDNDWIVAAPNQRVAAYTNIPPGHYTFEIESWETDRPQFRASARLDIAKDRFFYQTLWFQSVCVLAAILLLFMTYYIRLKQLQGRFNSIIAERTRIAREMHDTLLQGCASVSALLRVAVDDDVQDSESRFHLIQYASTQIEATMDEARQAVSGLRTGAQISGGLVESVRQMTERSSREHGVESTLAVNGEPFDMNPQTAHSLTMVAREAVFNAILHANPQTIRVKLEFSADALQIEVTDDGQGFVVANSQSEEHYGIQGMRERIAVFGGTLSIESAPQMGTSVLIHLSRAGVLTASSSIGARSLPVLRS
jgi:signal transduction histidine kinase/ligand-binding sensor domain-containing protein